MEASLTARRPLAVPTEHSKDSLILDGKQKRWVHRESYIIEVSLNSTDSIKLIVLILKTMIGSLELNFLLPILFLLYIVLLLPVTVNNLLKKLYIVNKLH